MMAVAQARAEVMMIRTSETDVIFSRINASLFSAITIVSLLFFSDFSEISLCAVFFSLTTKSKKEQNFQDVISVAVS